MRQFRKSCGEFSDAFEKGLDDFSLDEIDGADEMFYRKRYFLKRHRSLVFNSDLIFSNIFTEYKYVIELMSSITEDNGVFKKIIRPGDGTFPEADVEIFLHYNGFLEGGDEPFDASIMRKELPIFKLGDCGLFPGMQLAVKSMHYNEVSQFIFTPKFFFGSLGCPPRIPKGVSSMFFIELLDIKSEKAEKKIHEKTFEELQSLSFEEILGEVEKLNDKANAKYQFKLYEDAIIRYKLGLQVLDNYIVGTAGEETTKNLLKLKLMSNMVQCYLLTKNTKKAMQVCKLSLSPKMPKPKNGKLHFRYAKLLILQNDPEGAVNALREGMLIEPSNQALFSLEKEALVMLKRQERTLVQNNISMSKYLFRH